MRDEAVAEKIFSEASRVIYAWFLRASMREMPWEPGDL